MEALERAAKAITNGATFDPMIDALYNKSVARDVILAFLDPGDEAMQSLLAVAIGKADGFDSLSVTRTEYAKHARAAIAALRALVQGETK